MHNYLDRVAFISIAVPMMTEIKYYSLIRFASLTKIIPTILEYHALAIFQFEIS